MKIFFIRHGETTGDIENRYGGDYDDHLTERGREQSEALGQQLKDRGIEVIFASSLVRAQETANILSKYTGAPISLDEGLRERNQYGVLTGMVKKDAIQKHPEMVELLKDRLNTIEGGESYEAFRDRVSVAFWNIVKNNQHKNIAFVSHGGPLRVLFRDILKWGEIDNIGDCAFVELEKEGGIFSWIHSGGFTPTFQVPVFTK